MTRAPLVEIGLAQLTTRAVLVLTLFVCVVLPHSFQAPTAGLLALAAILSLMVVRHDEWLQRNLMLYILGAVVTIIYVWIGYAHGATRPAINQTLAVYLVSPLVWMLIAAVTMQQLGVRFTARLLVWLTWVAIASVALFFYAFLSFGREAVAFLSEDANVNVSGGFAGATMLVYGSLIFLTSALFAEPMMVRNRWWRAILLGLLVLAALTSGRSALILAGPIGLLVGFVLRQRQPGEGGENAFATTFVLGVIAVAVIVLMDVLLEELDLSVIFGEFTGELLSGGGDVRTEQIGALWDGIERTYALGAGHGIGVSYIRNFLFPWRYEVIPIASVFRVGLIGTIVYALPFVLYAIAILRRYRARSLSTEDNYMVGGFIGVALAAVTNPYIESFVFQWMYFLPVMSIGIGRMVSRPVIEASSLAHAAG